jgi:hypothetical protein
MKLSESRVHREELVSVRRNTSVMLQQESSIRGGQMQLPSSLECDYVLPVAGVVGCRNFNCLLIKPTVLRLRISVSSLRLPFLCRPVPMGGSQLSQPQAENDAQHECRDNAANKISA